MFVTVAKLERSHNVTIIFETVRSPSAEEASIRLLLSQFGRSTSTTSYFQPFELITNKSGKRQELNVLESLISCSYVQFKYSAIAHHSPQMSAPSPVLLLFFCFTSLVYSPLATSDSRTSRSFESNLLNELTGSQGLSEWFIHEKSVRAVIQLGIHGS